MLRGTGSGLNLVLATYSELLVLRTAAPPKPPTSRPGWHPMSGPYSQALAGHILVFKTRLLVQP